MPLAVLFLEGLVYSFGLAVILIGWLAARQLPQANPERQRLMAWLPVLATALLSASIFFMQQTSYLMRDYSGTATFWSSFDMLSELAFVAASIPVTLLYIRFARIAFGLDKRNRLLRAANWVMAALVVVYTASFVVNLDQAASRIAAGYAVGWPELIPIGAGILLVSLHVAYRKKPLAPAPKFLFRSMFFLIVGIIPVETTIYLVPDAYWNQLPVSKYLLETGLVYLVAMLLSLLYIRREYNDGKPDPRLTPGTAPAGQLTLEAIFQRLELSPREIEVVGCLCHGMTNQQIADKLFISMSTVKTHLHRILEKTGQPSRTALVAWLGIRNPPA